MALNLASEDDWPTEPLIDLSPYDLEDILKLEDGHSPSIPTVDEVMDSTEQDNTSVREELDQQANINHDDLDGADTKLNGDDEGGLFGSGSEDEEGVLSTTEGKDHKLDDEELDSGDDEARNDRMDIDMDGYGAEEVETRQEVSIGDVKMSRHGYPRPSDDETYLLKLPNHLSIDAKRFSVHNFQPPSTDHHSHGPPSTTFSPAQTSKTTLRWRRSPNDPQKLQSNSRIIRWSDGSLTLQLGSNPMEQYELQPKPLAPSNSLAYEARLDSHTYLASVHQETSFAQITNHVTTSLNVQATTDQNDDALIRLQESMAAAVKGNKNAPDGGVPIISISEDPEQAKKRAELAEREKIRAQRRRKNQEERERDRANRVLGRSGLRTGTSGGLTVGGLEDDEGMATSKPRAKPARKPRRRNSEYSDDESDFRNRGHTREDEYDENDGFLVGSDEEPEVVADDSEEEEEMGEEKVRKEARSKKTESKNDGGDGGGSRIKKRRVVDEDDDEV